MDREFRLISKKYITIKPSPVPPSVLEKPVCSLFKDIYEHGCAGGDPIFCGTAAARVAPVSGIASAVVPTSGAPLFSGVTASNVPLFLAKLLQV